MSFYSDDPVRDAERYDRYQARRERQYPCCDCCGYRIAEGNYYDINGEIMCLECLTENYGKKVENYDPMGD
jgi:formylmethanofuran dehydrogenase subunit E